MGVPRMSLADEFIADLDSLVAERGEPIRLLRRTTGPEGMRVSFEARMMANVRSAAPTDLVEPGAKDTVILISPTALRGSRFPGLPRRDDGVVIDATGDPMNVDEVAPTRVAGELVRVRLLCRG